jgi:hypothetical protein
MRRHPDGKDEAGRTVWTYSPYMLQPDPVVLQPTLRLRWVHRLTEGKVLQQYWTDIDGSDGEWHDIPVDEEI